MTRPTNYRPWILAALLVAGACSDVGTGPAVDDAAISAEDQIALSVLDQPLAVDAALWLAGDGSTASPWHPSEHGLTSVTVQRARRHFDEAVSAMRRGDKGGAAQGAAEARTLVAGQVMAHGPQAVTAMIERLEDMAVSAAGDPGRPHDAMVLAGHMERLAGSARQAVQGGNMTAAAALGVMGEQLIAYHGGRAGSMAGQGSGTGMGQNGSMGQGSGMGTGMGQGHGAGTGSGMGQGHGLGTNPTGGRDHDGWMDGGSAANVELMVALGATAVDLAEGILAEDGADAEQAEYLAAARASLAQALEAAAGENLSSAHYLAGLAQWQALKAVVLPGGVTEDEVDQMLVLAQSLYDDAVLAVGDSPSTLQADLLARAGAMIQMALSHQGWRGSTTVSPLWRAAVMAAHVLDGVA